MNFAIKYRQKLGLTNMSHWEKGHGEFEFPRFILVQMTLISRRKSRNIFTILGVTDVLGL